MTYKSVQPICRYKVGEVEHIDGWRGSREYDIEKMIYSVICKINTNLIVNHMH